MDRSLSSTLLASRSNAMAIRADKSAFCYFEHDNVPTPSSSHHCVRDTKIFNSRVHVIKIHTFRRIRITAVFARLVFKQIHFCKSLKSIQPIVLFMIYTLVRQVGLATISLTLLSARCYRTWFALVVASLRSVLFDVIYFIEGIYGFLLFTRFAEFHNPKIGAT